MNKWYIFDNMIGYGDHDTEIGLIGIIAGLNKEHILLEEKHIDIIRPILIQWSTVRSNTTIKAQDDL